MKSNTTKEKEKKTKKQLELKTECFIEDCLEQKTHLFQNNLSQKFSEDKFNEYLYSLDSQIQNTNEILKFQDSLNKKLSDLNKEITINDVKLEKFIVKSESEDYYTYISKYSNSLDSLLLKFKAQLSELEKMKEIKEENKILKTKIELMEIKLKEEKSISEANFSNFKNFLCVELNNFTEYLNEFSSGGLFLNRFSSNNIEETGISLFFQNLKAIYRDLFKKEKKDSYQMNSYEVSKNKQLEEDYEKVVKELNDMRVFCSKYNREAHKPNLIKEEAICNEFPHLNFAYNYDYGKTSSGVKYENNNNPNCNQVLHKNLELSDSLQKYSRPNAHYDNTYRSKQGNEEILNRYNYLINN